MSGLAFPLVQDEDGYPPVDHGDVVGVLLEDGNYRLDNIPFYAHGVSSGDIIEAKEESEQLTFKGLVRSLRRTAWSVFTYRIQMTL